MESSKRIHGLDLLRCVAIVAVVLYHYPRSPDQMWLRALTHYGWAGVDLFFVLSGYLIAGQLFHASKTRSGHSIGYFYVRRFLRTLPNYYVMLALYALAVPKVNWTYTLFLQNFGSLENFSQSWSLCVEEHFYLFFPLVYWLVSRFSRQWVAYATFALVLVASGLVRYLVWAKARPDLAYLISPDYGYLVYLNKLFYPTHVRLDGLAMGVGLAALKHYQPNLWNSLLARGNAVLAAGVALLGLAAALLYPKFTAYAVVFGFPLLSLGFSLLLVASVSSKCVLGRVKIPGVSGLALLSYSMYLTHVLAIALAFHISQKLGFTRFGLGTAAVSVVMVLGLSALLYFGIEKPFLRLRDWLGTRSLDRVRSESKLAA